MKAARCTLDRIGKPAWKMFRLFREDDMRRAAGLVVAVVLLCGTAFGQPAGSAKKIPITTSSPEARNAYLKGRDLTDKLRTDEARPLLNEAVSKDPNFAVAYLLRMQTSTSAEEFFANLKSAVAAADKVSEGERLLIRSSEAMSDGNTIEGGKYLQKLVVAYPDDERAHEALGFYYQGIQQYDQAIAESQKAIQLAPGFAPVYNALGYQLRDAQRNKEAEAAFRKYIELIPDEPNPYDSLAELLMKMGRFDESIENYRKALSLNAHFFSAYRGIATNLMYQDRHKEALEQLQKEYDLALNDGDREDALLNMAVCYVDESKISEALEQLSRMSSLAEQRGDKAEMAFNADTKGYLLLNAGRVEEAKTEFEKALELARQSAMPDAAKKSFELGNKGRAALVAGAMKDFQSAKREAEAMKAGFEALGNPSQVQAAHEALGMIALDQQNYDGAISHLTEANLQSPYVMFQLAKAYTGKKDAEKAANYYQKVANANTLPDFGYALVRKQAKEALGK
jgi:tetratricopeptide (TPR) repeat protein